MRVNRLSSFYIYNEGWLEDNRKQNNKVCVTKEEAPSRMTPASWLLHFYSIEVFIHRKEFSYSTDHLIFFQTSGTRLNTNSFISILITNIYSNITQHIVNILYICLLMNQKSEATEINTD